MKLMDVIAILGALAWLPQILSWIYKWLRRPEVSIFHDSESEVGCIKNGAHSMYDFLSCQGRNMR